MEITRNKLNSTHARKEVKFNFYNILLFGLYNASHKYNVKNIYLIVLKYNDMSNLSNFKNDTIPTVVGFVSHNNKSKCRISFEIKI